MTAVRLTLRTIGQMNAQVKEPPPPPPRYSFDVTVTLTAASLDAAFEDLHLRLSTLGVEFDITDGGPREA